MKKFSFMIAYISWWAFSAWAITWEIVAKGNGDHLFFVALPAAFLTATIVYFGIKELTSRWKK